MVVSYGLREVWAEWLNEWDWEWFVTLTFKEEVGIMKAERLWRRWVRELNEALDDRVGYFRVMEWQKNRKVPHFHALMLNLHGARRLTWMDRWNALAGYARIWPYQKDKGADHYLSKYVIKSLADYEFGGCVLRT